MSNKLFLKRINELKNLLKVSNQAIILTNEVNIGYFCGFFHSEGVMLITQEQSYLLVDFRYFEAAQKKSCGCEVICFNRLFDELVLLLQKNNIKNVYFEASDISVSKFTAFKNAFEKNNIECISTSELDNHISSIRIIKDKTEFDKILKAQQIAERAFNEVLNYIKPEISEKEISARLEFLMKMYGAENKSFDLITITGKKTSLPHGVPTDDKIKAGDFFTLDFGAVYEGYHSDTTRTFAIGYATDEMNEIYNIVLDAQLSALEKIKSGVLCSDVDKTARDIITQKGFGEYFGHSTGHGVGLQIHEAPTVSVRSDTVLKSGMIITDEPGIYLPDKFGVRIEDMVCVTDDGYINFVSLPKELIIL
jgi:Xaa-Pro aminopeptidase